MRGKFLLLFAVVMKTWGLLIILSELLMCRRQGEERYFTTGQAGVIGMGFRENGFPDIREQGRLDFSFLLQQRPQPLAPAFWGCRTRHAGRTPWAPAPTRASHRVMLVGVIFFLFRRCLRLRFHALRVPAEFGVACANCNGLMT